MKKLNVGVIGAGRIGKVHAETIAFRIPEAAVVAIADPNLEAAKALAIRCGGGCARALGGGVFCGAAGWAGRTLLCEGTPFVRINKAAERGEEILL